MSGPRHLLVGGSEHIERRAMTHALRVNTNAAVKALCSGKRCSRWIFRGSAALSGEPAPVFRKLKNSN